MDARFVKSGLSCSSNQNAPCAESSLRLEALGSRGTKRKWCSVETLPLRLGYPLSSSDSESLGTACTTTSSAEEIEESLIKLDFTMHLGKEPCDVDSELSLCTEVPESGITTVNIDSDLPKSHSTEQNQVPVSSKGAEGRSANVGGLWCKFLGCTKSDEERKDFCISNSGGERCSMEGCPHASGWKRCKESCSKSVVFHSGHCISHGGGRSCTYPGCTKGAQGSTLLCKGREGENLCTYPEYSKRCTYPECTKSAQGRFEFPKGHERGRKGICVYGEGNVGGVAFMEYNCGLSEGRVYGRRNLGEINLTDRGFGCPKGKVSLRAVEMVEGNMGNSEKDYQVESNLSVISAGEGSLGNGKENCHGKNSLEAINSSEGNLGNLEERCHVGSSLRTIELIRGNLGKFDERFHGANNFPANNSMEGNMGKFGGNLFGGNFENLEERCHGGVQLGAVNLVGGNFGSLKERFHGESSLGESNLVGGNLGSTQEKFHGSSLGEINLMRGNLENLEERVHGGSLMNLFRHEFGGCYKFDEFRREGSN